MSAAIIILRRKQFIRRFRERGATSPDRALPFAEVGMRRSWIFDRLMSRGVFVAAGNDRFWMNEPVAQAFLEAQRRRALMLGAVLLVAFLVFLIASNWW